MAINIERLILKGLVQDPYEDHLNYYYDKILSILQKYNFPLPEVKSKLPYYFIDSIIKNENNSRDNFIIGFNNSLNIDELYKIYQQHFLTLSKNISPTLFKELISSFLDTTILNCILSYDAICHLDTDILSLDEDIIDKFSTFAREFLYNIINTSLPSLTCCSSTP